MPELAETILDLPVRRGIPKWVGGLYEQVESPVFATAVGLVLTGARRDRPADAVRASRARRGLARRGPDGAPRPQWLRRSFDGAAPPQAKASQRVGRRRPPAGRERTMRGGAVFRLEEDRELAAKIRVVGLGGGGSNAVNRMISSRFTGVTFAVANTDAQALRASPARSRSSSAPSSPGASAPAPTRRSAAASEDREVLHQTARRRHGLHHGRDGRRHGAGAPVVAAIAKELGALTVACVTKPFQFEGPRRMRQADAGIQELGGSSTL